MPGAVLTSSSQWRAVAVAHEVDAAPAAAAGGEERCERERAHLLLGRAVEAGADVLRVVGDVLRVVVVVLAGRHDADRRQRLVAEHADGVLVALDQLLHQQLAGVARGERDGLRQIGVA